MKKCLYSVGIILILLLLVLSGCTTKSTNDDSTDNNGGYAIDFEFTLLDGSKKSLSEYQGQYVLVDFFGVTCQPCQYQMVVLTGIFENYPEIEIISIDVWIYLGETTELVEQFISSGKEQGVNLDWTFGVDDSRGTLYNKYANQGIPMIYLFDKNGNIYYSQVGYTEYSVLAGKIDDLIS